MEDQFELQFTKGFNHGYTISKHNPELSNKILKGLQPANDYSQGIVEGQKEHEKEKIKSSVKDSEKNKSQSKEKDFDKEK